MPLITRQNKGSKLTIQEMDDNLLYLESLEGDKTIQVSGVTVLSSSFTLVSGVYEATISNVNILATSIVEVIPANSSYTVVKNAEFLPQTDSSVGAVKIYSINLPSSDIIVTLNITNL